MKPPSWVVIEHLTNIRERMDKDGDRKLSPEDQQKKAVQEFWLCWEGRKAHVLTGERGKIILEEFAAELNAKDYVPRFEKGKLLMDMTASQIKKLALLQSPPLPLES